jgi:hypothetical protein
MKIGTVQKRPPDKRFFSARIIFDRIQPRILNFRNRLLGLGFATSKIIYPAKLCTNFDGSRFTPARLSMHFLFYLSRAGAVPGLSIKFARHDGQTSAPASNTSAGVPRAMIFPSRILNTLSDNLRISARSWLTMIMHIRRFLWIFSSLLCRPSRVS